MFANHNCTRCPLHSTTSTVCIWGEGPRHADIMLIGEAPGAEEERLDRPFVGASGKQVDECLELAGLSRERVYISNVVKCRPPGNRDPTKAEAAACFSYLAEEIQRVKPKVIVCVGRQALMALTGEIVIARARGRLLSPNSKVRIGDAKMIATYHPAAAMYNGGQRDTILSSIVEDFKYAQNLANPKTAQSVRTLLPEGYTSQELIDALTTLRECRELSCDLEWLAVPGAKVAWPWTPNVELLSMSLTGKVDNGQHTVAFAWPPSARGLEALKRFLSTRSIIGHNIQADCIWLLHAGIESTISGDSMLLSYLLDEHRRGGLKGLAPLVAGVEAGWEERPRHLRPRTESGWLELLTYNAGDTENTLSLHDALLAQLTSLPKERRENITRVYRSLLLPAVKPFARMALRGAPLDLKTVRKQQRRQERLYRRNIERLAKLTGMREDAAERLANSPTQVTRYARDAYGLEVNSSRAEDLDDYAEQYPALRYIKAIKHHRKMKSTYLEPWERLLIRQRDGRLHSVYLLGATRTGRLSAEIEEGGSLLLVPRGDEIRDCIAAPDDVDGADGWEILSADYSQLELRIAAWLGPERTMRRLFAEGVDIHTATAAYLISKRQARLTVAEFWAQREKWQARVTKDERQNAKGANFGLIYGLQEEHLASYVKKAYQVEMSPDEAHLAREGYFELYPDLTAWHERASSVDFERGYTLTPFGRYRFDLGEPTKAINTPIQATGSDLCMFALTVLDERLISEGIDAQIIGFVHDAILVLSRKRDHDRVKALIEDAMQNPPLERVGIDEIPVPLVAEVLAGSTWANAH